MTAFIHSRRKYFIVPIILIVFAIVSTVVMILWNVLMPVLFNLPTIKFWQAAGFLILSRLLFGTGRFHGPWSHSYKRSYLREKISKMTPEERKEYFKKMHLMRHSWFQHECGGETESEQKQQND